MEIMEKTSLQNQVWSSVHLAPTWPAEQRYNTGLNTFKKFSYSLTFKNMRSFKNTFLCRKRMFSRTSLTPRKLDWENNKRPCFSKKWPGSGSTIGLGQLSQGVDESPIKCGHFVTSNVGLRKAPRGRPSVLATRFLKLLLVPYSKNYTTRPSSK